MPLNLPGISKKYQSVTFLQQILQNCKRMLRFHIFMSRYEKPNRSPVWHNRSAVFLIGCLPLLLLAVLTAAPASAAPVQPEVTVLFTHDLHSHFLPQLQENGGQSGGYARLKTALDRERQKHPDALTLDGGDFSIGSLIQTLYTSQAAELRTMGAMGYDAVTIGNHEFDHEGTGFAAMLRAAVRSGDPTPALLTANYRPANANPDKLDIQRAMAAYGVQEYLLLERGGVTFGLFGLMGRDSHDCAPASGFELEDPVDAARRCVDALNDAGAEFIICLSHSGTDANEKRSEDEQLARQVEGIDLIVSGHTHTTLEQPILAGDTYIVSAGPYCQNLGSITLRLSEDHAELLDYHLVPIDGTLPQDAAISHMIDGWKDRVEGSYLSQYDLTYDQVLTSSPFTLPLPPSGVQSGNALGELVADAFLWATRELEANSPGGTTVTVTADGVLRAPLPAGEITASMAFDVLSMGVGHDGNSGFPLVGVYLTGKELKAVAEVDASVTPLMPAAQLYLSGLTYRFNVHRVPFNRVIETKLTLAAMDPASNQLPGALEDDKLYRVVTGMYSAQMLGSVKSKSLGLLSLEPKQADGSPVTDFNDCILYDSFGSEIKEWYALAAYLQSFGAHGLPQRYAAPDGRKAVSASWNPVQLVRNPNWLTLAASAALALAVTAAVLLARRLVRRKQNRRYGGSARRPWQ